MTKGAGARLAALAAFVSAAHGAAAAPDTSALIAALARDAPASIAFAEVRFSSLLREPLVVSGDLSYRGPVDLERRVTQPYRETTAVRGDSVSVDREGAEIRTFSLRRAPELAGFLRAFGALLAGDEPALRGAFSVSASGDDSAWQLELNPSDARARRRLRAIVIHGSGAEPRCFAMLDTDGGGSVMLVGAAAAEPVPRDASLDRLLAECGTK